MPSHSHQQDGGGGKGTAAPADVSLSFSESAAAHVKNYLTREGKTDSAVRVAAVRSHCMGGRGFTYTIDLDSMKPDDTIIKGDGLTLLVDQESLHRLRGTRIDYEESLQGRGLVIRNPNAIGKCHCGRHDIFEHQAETGSGEC